ncbi:MAG: hypothetical protein WCY29_16060 [Novosphingobium sp.]
MKRHHLCNCPHCAELDLAFPGEGRQLAFALTGPPARLTTRPRRRRLADIEAEAFAKVPVAEGPVAEGIAR